MIFLSYSWHDALYTHQFAQKLLSTKTKVWLDIWNLNLNYSIQEQLEKAIQETSTFTLIDSLYSRQSKWVKLELSIAKKTNTPIEIIPYYTIYKYAMFNKEIIKISKEK